MGKASILALVTSVALLLSGSLAPTSAATAQNSQAGAYGPSNVDAPIRGSNASRR